MGKPRQLPKDLIQKEAAGIKLSKDEAKIFQLVSADAARDAHTRSPFVALKYFQAEWECFSAWEKEELRQFTEFLGRLGAYSWQQVYETGGKANKHGLAYTKYDLAGVRAQAKVHLDRVRQQISDDISFFELRVNQNKLRVHGFQAQSAFFLVLLDREHAVFPQ